MNTHSERRQLINLAYRLLGSPADAEDVVQETYARWYALSPAEQQAIENPAAWLTKVASRICLTQLTSARVRRETYVGEWIPEPIPDPAERRVDDPADRITLDESVSTAFLVVLESLTPAERVAFILHDVFRYPFKEIADIVGRSPAACRQLASSARRRLADVPPTPAAVQARIVRDFKHAWESGDIHALIALLDPAATTTADTGGHASVFARSLTRRRPDRRNLREVRRQTHPADHQGMHRQRPPRPPRRIRRQHRHRLRLRHHRRPDHPRLGHQKPRQTRRLAVSRARR